MLRSWSMIPKLVCFREDMMIPEMILELDLMIPRTYTTLENASALTTMVSRVGKVRSKSENPF